MSQPPVRYYCTYFDSNYLARGLVLHQSLEEHSEGDFRFYVLCLDDRTYEFLERLGKRTIVPVRLRDVEAWDPDLLEAKTNRSLVEYYFTLSPILPLYVLEHFQCDLVTYLDADLMFFSSPEAIFMELGNKSIFITEHRFSPHLRENIKYGRFNVQCQSFRKDETGLACLRRWREQCLEWCYDRLEDGKFADQKYLDEWPALYGEELVISRHPGIGVAPWNVEESSLHLDDGRWIAGDQPLVCYHFHGFRQLFWRFVRLGTGEYNAKSRWIPELYDTYMARLRTWNGLATERRDHRMNLGVLRWLSIALRQGDLAMEKRTSRNHGRT